MLHLGPRARGGGRKSCWRQGARSVPRSEEGTRHTDLSSSGTLFFPDKPQLEESSCPGNQTWWKGWSRCLPATPRETRPHCWCVPGMESSSTSKCHRRRPRTTPESTAARPLTSWALSAKTLLWLFEVTVAPTARPRVEIPRGLGFVSRRGKKKDLHGLGRVRLEVGLVVWGLVLLPLNPLNVCLVCLGRSR